MAFTSIFTGDITYTSLITMPPEWAVIDYVEIQLWAGRMAFLSQVELDVRATLMHTMPHAYTKRSACEGQVCWSPASSLMHTHRYLDLCPGAPQIGSWAIHATRKPACSSA